MIRSAHLLLVLLILSVTFRTLGAAEPTAEDSEIKAMLHKRAAALGEQVSLVAGIVDHGKTSIYGEGKIGSANDRPTDGNTIFEIGSVTKVFTGLLLADMVQRGELKLDDPISKFLPPSAKVPTRNGKQITLLDLATHTSGLPRLPDNLAPKDWNNPYADYTTEGMYAFLASYRLPRDIGAQYEYSNLGIGLLGHILELKTGSSYEALVERRICKPLGMNDTRIALSSEMKRRFAAGHDESGAPAENWDFGALSGCGALRSTVHDLLKLLAANMGAVKSDLDPAMRLQQILRRGTDLSATQIALCWHITTRGGVDLVWHNGGTGGYRSFIGFDKKHQRAVAVLVNSANDVDDIGMRLLENEVTPRKHLAIKLDPKIYDSYVGKYRLATGAEFTVRRDKDRLMVQLSGQQFFRVFPESETEFFYKVVDAQLTFVKDKAGKVTQLILHQDGFDQTAVIEKTEPSRKHVAVKLDPKIYDSYAGKYRLAPGVEFTVRRENDRLMVQLTGQEFYPVFPASETEFFYKVVDAQLTFVKNKAGEVTDLTLHQNGLDQKAIKEK